MEEVEMPGGGDTTMLNKHIALLDQIWTKTETLTKIIDGVTGAFKIGAQQ